MHFQSNYVQHCWMGKRIGGDARGDKMMKKKNVGWEGLKMQKA